MYYENQKKDQKKYDQSGNQSSGQYGQEVYSPSSAYESGNPDFEKPSKDPRSMSLG